MAAHGGLHANLVHPARLRLEFDERAALDRLQHTIPKQRLFGAGHFGLGFLGASFIRDFSQPILPHALNRFNRSRDRAPVYS